MTDDEPTSAPARRAARPGPAPSLTVQEIAAAAAARADAQGLGAVTMRAVAASLGITAPALYRYLDSRDDLLSAMVDHASGQLDHPDPSGDWLADLLDVAAQQLALYRAHPWLAQTARHTIVLGPNALDHLDRCLAILEPLDAPDTSKMEAIALTTGAAALFATAGPGPDASTFGRLDPGRHPRLTALINAADPGPPSPDLFERAVTALLRGVLEPR